MNTTENNPAPPASAPEASDIQTWQQRLHAIQPSAERFDESGQRLISTSHMMAEIADLRAVLAAPVAPVQAQGVPEVSNIDILQSVLTEKGIRKYLNGDEVLMGQEDFDQLIAAARTAPLPPAAAPAPELTRDKRDAARYRFVRTADNLQISRQAARDPVAYDAAIDAAIQAQGSDAA